MTFQMQIKWQPTLDSAAFSYRHDGSHFTYIQWEAKRPRSSVIGVGEIIKK